jgi:hypothetical protein
VDVAAVEANLGAHLLQALEVQVHRARADGAAARQAHPRLAAARDERAEHEDAGAHLADDVVGRLGVGHGAAEAERAVGAVLDGDAVLGEQRAHGRDVGEAGHVLQHEALVGEQARDHERQRRVLGAADGNGALERPAASDADAVHPAYSLGSATPRWRMYFPALSA